MRLLRTFALVVLLALLILTAGCIEIGAPYSDGSTPPGIVALPYTDLSALALGVDQVPFAVQISSEKTENPGDYPSLAYYGATRVYSRVYWGGGAIGSPTYYQYMQRIIEFPQGNASSAFAMIRNAATTVNPAGSAVSVWPDPGIADESFGITTGKSPIISGGSTAQVIFRRSNIIEIISFQSLNPDTGDLTKAAHWAAAKVP